MASSALHSPTARSEGPISPAIRRPREGSVSSDRPSLSGLGGLPSPPTVISPDPIYIAASAASQIVTNDHDSNSDAWFDQHGIEPSTEPAVVSPAALKLVNRFLDQLLFNFLSVSRSTSLASLRPAVAEVLKPKLAKDAIHGADQELEEYLGGGEDEELLAFHNGTEPNGNWDVELVWKRTRLRCMVYSSLGDMEEEDEDLYIEQEQLDGPPGSNTRFQNNSGVLSPAVAIFLTSILEFLGEQALIVSGQAAYHRLRTKFEKDKRDGVATPRETIDRIVVEETDMERVALDRTLGRLWRGWKKKIRSPTASISMSRSFSRESLRSRGPTSRRGSVGNEEPVPSLDDTARKPSITEVIMNNYHTNDTPANIPLPIKKNDVEEIEVPGLAENSDDEAEMETDVEPGQRRPNSFAVFPRELPGSKALQESRQTLNLTRERSSSLPSPATSPYASQKVNEKASLTRNAIIETPGQVNSAQSRQKDNEVEDDLTEKHQSRKPLVERPTSVSTFGAAAVAGIATLVQGPVQETEVPVEAELETDEEPEILTSSRVSIGGRVTPEAPSQQSRPSSVQSSVRIVDVSSPRSPAPSYHGSLESTDYVNSVRPAVSRSGSLRSSVSQETQVPRIGTPVQRISTGSSLGRSSSGKGNKSIRNSAGESISEAGEQNVDVSKITIPERSSLRDSSNTIASERGIVSSAPAHQDRTVEDANSSSRQFVLAAPPIRKSSREGGSVPLANGFSSNLRSNAPEIGAPPLTPLREMLENAPDTCDETSSIAPSHDTQSFTESYNYSPEQANAVTFTRSSDPGKTTPLRAVSERLATKTSPQAHREDDLTPGSEEHNRSLRQIPTSGSSSSSIKSHKLKAVRTSEDGIPGGEDKGRSFEQLIRSDQTIQYTLTPQSMRQIESESSKAPLPPSPPFAKESHPKTPRSTSYNSIDKLTSLNSNPSKTPFGSSTKGENTVPQPASNIGARVRPRAPQARDARVNRDSLGDFADFIRSTGPPEAYDGLDVPLKSTPSAAVRGSVVNGSRNISAPIQITSTNGVRNTTASRVNATTAAPKRSDSVLRKRYEARDAAVPYGDNSSDLIDFIRQGPPSEKSHQNPRIPRTVAPFRDTMDSDQMTGALGARVTDDHDARHSQASTSISNEPSTISFNSSVNSTSALLNSQATIKQTQKFNSFDNDEDMMPKRKTRRVRDPYAIDLSDEEDELNERPTKPMRHEESLIEFLNNVPPPPESTVTPIFEPSPKTEPKKSSGARLISKFSRNGSISGLSLKPSSPSDSRPNTQNITGRQTLSQFSVTSRFNHKGSDESSVAKSSNYISQLDSERKPATRVAQISYQPREATQSSYSRTNDLAEFFRNTPPPPSNQTSSDFAVVGPQNDEGSFSKMFSRKKKTAAAV